MPGVVQSPSLRKLGLGFGTIGNGLGGIMKSMRYVSCFLVGTIVAQALAQSEPLTLTIVPIGGTQVDGGQLVTAEVFLTANVAIIVSGVTGSSKSPASCSRMN